MIPLPIAVRELRAAARKPSTYWLRTGTALVFFIIAVWIFTVGRNERPSELSQIAFTFIAGAAGVFCLVCGVRYTADCISEEKRQGTLGLLFLTDLKGYDVVVGKLAASSLNAFHAVLAMIPILTIPILLGGVSGYQVARVGLAVVNLLLFSLAVGMVASALYFEVRRATSLTLIILLSVTFVAPATGGLLLANNRISQSAIWAFLIPSPGFTLAAAFDGLFTKGLYWSSFAIVHALAWLAFGGACWLTPRVWQDRPASEARLKWRDRMQRLLLGSPARRGERRRQMLDCGAYFWVTARHVLRKRMVWSVLGGTTVLWLGFFAKYRGDWLNESVYVFTALTLSLIFKGWAISESGRQIAEDRQNGTIEVLLTTPLTLDDFIQGQMRVIKRQFLGPAWFITAVFAFFAVMTFKNASNNEDQVSWLTFWIALTAMLFVDLWAIFWSGLADGLVYGNPHRAASVTFSRIFVCPWILIVGVVFVAVLFNQQSKSPDGGPVAAILLWFVAGLTADLYYGTRAHLLLEEFRSIAALPVAARKTIWKLIFG